MKLRSRMGVNLLTSWAGHVVMLVVGFFLMPYVLHVMGASAYGSWIFINSIASYAGLLYLGFGQTLSRFVATHSVKNDWDRVNQVVSVVFVAFTCLGLFSLSVAGALAWTAPWWNTWEHNSLAEVRLVIVLLGLNAACGMMGSTFGGVLIGLQRIHVEKSIFIIGTLFRVTITMLFLRQHWGLFTLAAVFLATTIFESLSYAVCAFRVLPTLSVRRKHLTAEAFRESFGFSLRAFVGIVAGQLIAATDLIVIGQFLGKSAIVPYYIALRLCQFIQKPIQQIGDVSLPKAGELASHRDHKAIQKLVARSVGLAFMLVSGLYIGATYFGDTLITTWMGPEYIGSFRFLLILMTAQLVTLPSLVLRQILFGSGHVRFPALLYMGEALCNVVCCLALIGKLGLLGVALGTTVPLVLGELTLLWPFAVRKLNLDLARTLGDILKAALLPLLVLWGFCSLTNTYLSVGWWEACVQSLTSSDGFTVPTAVETALSRWGYILLVTAGGGSLFGGVWLAQSRWSEQRPRRALARPAGDPAERRDSFEPLAVSALQETSI